MVIHFRKYTYMHIYFPMQRACPIYIPKIALYFRHYVYILYTAVSHSQLPFFFLFVFLIYLYFSFLIWFSALQQTPQPNVKENHAQCSFSFSLFTCTPRHEYDFPKTLPTALMACFRNVFQILHDSFSRSIRLFAFFFNHSLRATSACGRVSSTFDAGGHCHVDFT